jgi:hypothetical protein
VAIRHAYARSGLCVTLLVGLLTAAHAEPSRGETAGAILISTGALGLFFGGTFAVRSVELRDDVHHACAMGCDWSDPTLRSEDAAGHRANTLAVVGLVGGGVAVIGGVVMILLSHKHAPVAIAPTPHGAVMTATFAFQ